MRMFESIKAIYCSKFHHDPIPNSIKIYDDGTFKFECARCKKTLGVNPEKANGVVVWDAELEDHYKKLDSK